jgi:hypothetical protein
MDGEQPKEVLSHPLQVFTKLNAEQVSVHHVLMSRRKGQRGKAGAAD